METYGIMQSFSGDWFLQVAVRQAPEQYLGLLHVVTRQREESSSSSSTTLRSSDTLRRARTIELGHVGVQDDHIKGMAGGQGGRESIDGTLTVCNNHHVALFIK